MSFLQISPHCHFIVSLFLTQLFTFKSIVTAYPFHVFFCNLHIFLLFLLLQFSFFQIIGKWNWIRKIPKNNMFTFSYFFLQLHTNVLFWHIFCIYFRSFYFLLILPPFTFLRSFPQFFFCRPIHHIEIVYVVLVEH